MPVFARGLANGGRRWRSGSPRVAPDTRTLWTPVWPIWPASAWRTENPPSPLRRRGRRSGKTGDGHPPRATAPQRDDRRTCTRPADAVSRPSAPSTTAVNRWLAPAVRDADSGDSVTAVIDTATAWGTTLMSTFASPTDGSSTENSVVTNEDDAEADGHNLVSRERGTAPAGQAARLTPAYREFQL